MEDITYFSVNEFSKGILEFAEKAEHAKVLQGQLAVVDENSVRQLEVELAERKWAITDYLSNGSNYEEWTKFGNNNGEMLSKYVQKDYFQNEFVGTKLKERINRDFAESLSSNPELGFTKREKATLKHYEDNMVPQEKRTFLKEFDSVVANIHNKDKCFSRNFSKMLSDLPKKLTKEVEKTLALVKGNPLLLKDNPHHYVLNRGRENPSVSADQLKDILEDANMGDSSACTKLEKITSSMESMSQGDSNKSLIEKYRKQFLGNDKPTLKKEI